MITAQRILVAVNGNPTDTEAVALACEMAKRTKAEVYAIHVIEVRRNLPIDVDLPTEVARGEHVLSEAQRAATQWSVAVRTELLQARDVGTAIVDEAVERESDLIVMGITYKRKFGEFDLGKTAPYVLKHAPCRVLLARAAPAAGEALETVGYAAAHGH